MKIIILTSSLYGTAANHLPQLIEKKTCEISMVILNHGHIANKRKYYLRKLRKMLKIGPLGALNGIRMRKWFNKDVEKYIQFKNLEETCRQHNIPFFRVSAINCKETRDLFKQADADLGISLGNGYIGKAVFNVPKYGMLNIHHEILPAYQNAQSIIWQIYNGSTHTGYTIHKIDRHIDTGEILYQSEVAIKFKETLSDTIANTSALLLHASAAGLLFVIENFNELNRTAKPQGTGRKYTTPTIWQFFVIYIRFKRIKKDMAINTLSSTESNTE
jgi:methionyl-tRNA formyltransferase